MPIKGFTDRPRMIRGGKLRLGIKVKKTNKQGKEVEYPQKIDYFKFDPNDESLRADFLRFYGEKPRELPVMLPSNYRDDILPHEYKYWKGRKVFCHGDAEQGWRMTGAESWAREPVQCPCPLLNDPAAGRADTKKHPCKPEGTLRVLLPELPTLHLFELTVHKIALKTLLTCLDRIEGAFGQFAGVELVLSLKEESVEFQGKSARIWTPHLDARISIADVIRERRAARLGGQQAPPLPAQPAALPQGGAVAQADDGTVFDRDTGEIIEEAPPEPVPEPEPGPELEAHTPSGAPPTEDQLYIECDEMIDELPTAEQGRWRYQLKKTQGGKALWDLKAQLIAAQAA